MEFLHPNQQKQKTTKKYFLKEPRITFIVSHNTFFYLFCNGTFLVTTGTAKVNASRRMGDGTTKKIHVVTPDWMWTCAERWERVDERLYPLQRGGQV